MTDDDTLTLDEERFANAHLKTGIYVRARSERGWHATDIGHLDTRSLLQWLRAGEGRGASTVALLLGHDPERIAEEQKKNG